MASNGFYSSIVSNCSILRNNNNNKKVICLACRKLFLQLRLLSFYQLFSFSLALILFYFIIQLHLVIILSVINNLLRFSFTCCSLSIITYMLPCLLNYLFTYLIITLSKIFCLCIVISLKKSN